MKSCGKGTTALVVRVLAPPGGPGKETGNSLSGKDNGYSEIEQITSSQVANGSRCQDEIIVPIWE